MKSQNDAFLRNSRQSNVSKYEEHSLKFSPDSMSMDSPQALDGLRVLDISGPSGFYCTKLLADLGADVVRVEPPGDDPNHQAGPLFDGETDPNQSLYRWHFHTNKRSVLLDINSSSGRRVFDSLLSASDALVDTYRPSEAAARPRHTAPSPDLHDPGSHHHHRLRA